MVKNRKHTKLVANFEGLAWCPWVEVCGFIPTLASSNNMLGCQGFLCDTSNKNQHQENCVHGRHYFFLLFKSLLFFFFKEGGGGGCVVCLSNPIPTIIYAGNLPVNIQSVSIIILLVITPRFLAKLEQTFKILMTHGTPISYNIKNPPISHIATWSNKSVQPSSAGIHVILGHNKGMICEVQYLFNVWIAG